MDKVELRMKIVKSMMINAPILAAWDKVLSRIPLLIVPQGTSRAVLETLSCKGVVAVNGFHTRMERREMLSKAYTSAIYVCSRGNIQNMEAIEEFCNSSDLRESFSRLIIAEDYIIFDQAINSFAFKIFLDGTIDVKDILIKDIVPEEKDLALVKDRAETLWRLAEGNEDLKALWSSVAFLYPLCNEEEYETLICEAEKMVEEEDLSHNVDGIDQQFGDALIRWQKNTHYTEVVELPNIRKSEEEGFKEKVFYDDFSIYISQELFRKICFDMLFAYPTNLLKEKLKEAGILIADSAPYAARMTYYTENGEQKRKRMIKILREKLLPFVGIDFIELCLFGSNNIADNGGN